MLPFAIGSLLANAGVEFKIEDIVNSQPSDNTIQRCVEKNTANTINILPEVLRSRVNTRAEPEYLHENSIRGGVFLYDPAKLLLYFEIQLVDRVLVIVAIGNHIVGFMSSS